MGCGGVIHSLEKYAWIEGRIGHWYYNVNLESWGSKLGKGLGSWPMWDG